MYSGAPPRKRWKPEHDDDNESLPPKVKERGTRRPLVLVAAERRGKIEAPRIPTHCKVAIIEELAGKLDPDAVVMTDRL